MDSSAPSVDIPKSMERELLGSLLCTIDDSYEEIVSATTDAAEIPIPKNSFPQAHGDWTKNLFPHREENTPLPDKEAVTEDMNSSIPISNCNDLTKPETSVLPNIRVPFRFYMTVPPPPIASAMGMPPMRPPYMYCQPRNMAVLPPGGNMVNCRSQQGQYLVPRAPLTFIPPSMYTPICAPPPNWRYMSPQKREQLQQTVQSQQLRLNSPRMRIICEQNSLQEATQAVCNDLKTEVLKPSSKSNLQQSATSMQVVQQKNATEYVENTSDKENVQLLCKPCSIVPPLNGGHPVVQQTHVNTVNVLKNCSNFQSMQVSIMRGVQFNPQFQFQARPFINYKLLPPVSHLPRNHIYSHNSFQSRFLDSVTLNSIKRMQDHIHIQRNRYDEVPDVYSSSQKNISHDHFSTRPREVCMNYEDKVEIWLETNKQYINSKPIPCLKPFSALSHYAQSRQLSKFTDRDHKDDTTSKTCNTFGKGLIDILMTDKKHQKKISRKLQTLKHIFLSHNSLVKLKKGNDLEIKIKLLKKFLGEVELGGKMNLDLRSKVSKIKPKTLSSHECDMCHKLKKTSHLSTSRNRAGNKLISNLTAKKFDKVQITNMPTNDRSYKTVAYESFEYNTFPSKRVKLSNALSTYFDTDTCSVNEMEKMISDLDCYNMIADKLILVEVEENLNSSKSDKRKEMINGWTHFKLVVKTVLRNVTALIKSKYAKDVQYNLIKV